MLHRYYGKLLLVLVTPPPLHIIRYTGGCKGDFLREEMERDEEREVAKANPVPSTKDKFQKLMGTWYLMRSIKLEDYLLFTLPLGITIRAKHS